MITFIDLGQVRHKRDPGRCYRRAGWSVRGWTKGGLLCLGIAPDEMPSPAPPWGITGDLLAEVRDVTAR